MALPSAARTGQVVNTSPPPALPAPAAPLAPPTTASSAPSCDLADPLFAIEHLARLFLLGGPASPSASTTPRRAADPTPTPPVIKPYKARAPKTVEAAA